MIRRKHLVAAFAILLGATLSCDNSKSQHSANGVLERFYPNLRVGMPVSELQQAYPNLRFQSYYGFVVDASSYDSSFVRLGVQVAASVRQAPPSMEDRVATFHLFSAFGSSVAVAEKAITEALGHSPTVGCGGKSMRIQILQWPAPNRNIAVLHNPATADGEELVLVIVSSNEIRPRNLVTDYLDEPCETS